MTDIVAEIVQVTVEGTIEGAAVVGQYAEQARDAATRLTDQFLNLGDYVDAASYTVAPNSGAVARGSRGLTYPAGAGSGNGAQVRAELAPLDSMKAGETYTFRFAADTSASFTRGVAGSMLVTTASTTVSRAAVSRVVSGSGRMFVEIDYKLQGDEVKLIPVIGNTFVAGVSAEEWYSVTSLVIQLRSPASDAQTSNQQMLDTQMDRRLAGYAPGMSLGNQLERVAFYQTPAGGAVALGARGFTFPAGQTGQNTTGVVNYAVDAATQTGRTFGLRLALRRSGTFTRSFSLGFQVTTAAAPGGVGRAATIVRTDLPNLILLDYTYTLVGDEMTLLPLFQISSPTPAAVAETLEIVAFEPSYRSSLRPGATTTDETLADYVGDRMLAAPARRATRVIEADDFASLAAAMASITDNAPGNWVRINLSRKAYLLSQQLVIKPYVEIVGKGPESVVRLFLPNNTPATTVIANSVIDFRVTGLLKGFRVEGKNCQYGVHCDTTGQTFDSRTVFENMEVAHFGNQDSDFPNAWGAQNAIGAGVSGGQVLTLRECRLWAANGYPFTCHNNPNAKAPCRVELLSSTFVTDLDNGIALTVNAIGSRQADEWYMENCVIGGRWTFSVQGWVAGDVPDNRVEFNIVAANCSPAVFTNEDPGTTGSRVRPLVTNEEVRARNVTGATILFRTMLAFDGDRGRVRPMTSADPASLFAGVAWEDIPAGRAGRVKNRGHIALGDVLRGDALAIGFDDSFSIDATTPGRVVKGGSQGLLRALRSDAVRVG